MPLRCIVDLFSTQFHCNMHRTTTLFVLKPILETLFLSLMDTGWDEKIVVGNDIIRYCILRASITF